MRGYSQEALLELSQSNIRKHISVMDKKKMAEKIAHNYCN